MVDWFSRAATVARGLWTQATWHADKEHTLLDELERRATRDPHSPLLDFEGRQWTSKTFHDAVNQHAHGWHDIGIARGDVVALVMSNRPEFLFHLYGLGKLGAVAALINPHLSGPALRYALASCQPRALIVGTEHLEAVNAQARGEGFDDVLMLMDGSSDAAATGWKTFVASTDPTSPARTTPRRLGDVMAYIYTSGTTGKPKPAIVKHHRFWRAGHLVAAGLTLGRGDAIYNCLPLYHANGVMLAASAAILSGAKLVLARRFSVSRFWDDIHQSGATCFIYIGEVCRYLLNAPPHPLERRHGLRAIVGNGMRPEVWDRFVERFDIQRVIEFYGSTEGNAETANILGTSGSCGVLLPFRMALVRCDPETGELVRNARGFCESVRPNEPGLLLGKIAERNEFSGYTDAAASSAKVVRDVFKTGDTWFNTGDLLKRDRLRQLYFVDRLGDTFRWKGENVATTDVVEALTSVEGISEATVYGVEVPGCEGRAGMAAIVAEPDLRLEDLGNALEPLLPGYARPRFLRRVDALSVTGTFKHRKVQLRKEGYDPAIIDDPIFVWASADNRYVSLSPENYRLIVSGDFTL